MKFSIGRYYISYKTKWKTKLGVSMLIFLEVLLYLVQEDGLKSGFSVNNEIHCLGINTLISFIFICQKDKNNHVHACIT